MKRINSVRLRNFKRHTDRTVDLQPVNLVIGSNGSGKSALLDAVRFGAIGYFGNSKLPEEVFKSCTWGQREMMVRTELEGFSFERSLARVGDSLSMEIGIDGKAVKRVKDGQELVNTHIGNFLPMWSVAEFTSLSPEKKRDLLLELSLSARDRKAVDPKQLLTRVMVAFLNEHDDVGGPATLAMYFETKGKKVEDATFDELKAFADEKLAANEKAALSELLAKMHLAVKVKDDLSAAVSIAIEVAKDFERENENAWDRGTKAAEVLAEQRRSLEAQKPAGTVKDAETALDLAQQAKEAAHGLVQADAERRKAIREKETRLTVMENFIALKQKAVDGLPGLQSKLAELKRFDPGDTSDATHNELRDKAHAIEVELATAKAEAGSANAAAARKAELERQIAEAEQHMEKYAESAREALSDEDYESASETCRKIGNTESIAKDLWSHLQHQQENSNQALVDNVVSKCCDKCRADVQTALMDLGSPDPQAVIDAEAAYRKIAENKRAADLAMSKHAHNRRQKELYEQHKTGRDRLQSELAALTVPESVTARVKEIESRLQEANGAYLVEVNRLNEAKSAKARADRDIAEIEKHIAEAERTAIDLDQKRKEHESLAVEIAEDTARAGSPELPQAEYNKHSKTVEERKAQLRAITEWQAKEQAYTQAVADAEAKRIAYLVGKAIGKAVRTLREDIMREMTEPVTSLMREFLMHVDGDLMPFISLDNETGKRVVFKMGWKNGAGASINYESMSGGETAIFFVSLAYALTVLADPPLKVLLVEAGEIDDDNLKALMSGLVGVSERIGTSLVACWSDHVEDIPSQVNVINMAEAVAA